MVLVVCGLLVVAAGVHFARTTALPRGGETLRGTVVSVQEKRSSLSSDGRRLHAVTVEYRDPATGERRVLTPDGHRPEAYRTGDEVSLVRDPSTGEVRLPAPRRVAQSLAALGFGAVVVALGVLDVVGG
ncbi:DUF3592 domain-containing protein [Aquipuribacter sp. SD81]|uniref:DUF3592 domain-containing protein n=1 Tax=Aquipuribacter sp. SD81 TaxID=3127703 RepID=UPI0030160743